MILRTTCPVPVMEPGSMKQADSTIAAGMAHVRLIAVVYPSATLTVTLASAAAPTAAVAPVEASAKLDIMIGSGEEIDSA